MAKKLTFTLNVESVNKYRGNSQASSSDRIMMTACTKREATEDPYLYVEPEEYVTLTYTGKSWPFDDLGDTLTVTIEG